jgi:nitrate/nitrite transport system substrate-binding protein
VPDFNVFFRHFATYPYYSDAVWYLSQMRRWGQIPEPRSDAWFADAAKSVYRPDVYRLAAEALIAQGTLAAADFPDFARETGFRPPTAEFIDGVSYDGTRPNEYLAKLAIGLKGDEVLK